MTKGTDKKKEKTVVQSVPVLAKCSVIFSTKRLFKYSFCVCSPKLKTYQQYKKEVLFFFFFSVELSCCARAWEPFSGGFVEE